MNNNQNGGTGMEPQNTPTGWDISEMQINESSFLDETVKCTNTVYNQALVQSGQASNLNEAQHMPRTIECSCGQCNQCFNVGFLR